jgi:hypothetical protein
MHYLCFWDFTPNKFLLAILICAICAIKFGNLSRLFSNCAIYLLQSDFYESVFSYLSSQINDLSKYSARKFVSIVREVHGSKLIIVECVYIALKSLQILSCHGFKGVLKAPPRRCLAVKAPSLRLGKLTALGA